MRVCTFLSVKPGSSRAKRVGHKECILGWLAEEAVSASDKACRCAGVNKAADAGSGAALGAAAAAVKTSRGGRGQLCGSTAQSRSRLAGMCGHMRSASNSPCSHCAHVQFTTIFMSVSHLKESAPLACAPR